MAGGPDYLVLRRMKIKNPIQAKLGWGTLGSNLDFATGRASELSH